MTVSPFTAALAAIIAVFTWQTWWLGPGARRVPLVVVLPLIALVSWQIVREVRAGRGRTEGPSQASTLAAIGWAAALPAAIAFFGMFAGPPLYVASVMRWRGGETWRPTIALAMSVAAFVWLLFVVLLEQSVPPGLLWRLAG